MVYLVVVLVIIFSITVVAALFRAKQNNTNVEMKFERPPAIKLSMVGIKNTGTSMDCRMIYLCPYNKVGLSESEDHED